MSRHDERMYWLYLHNAGVLPDRKSDIARAYMDTLPNMMEALSVACEGIVRYQDYLQYKRSTLRYLASTCDEVVLYIQTVREGTTYGLPQDGCDRA